MVCACFQKIVASCVVVMMSLSEEVEQAEGVSNLSLASLLASLRHIFAIH